MQVMSFASQIAAFFSPLREWATTAVLSHRVRARHPTLKSHWTAIWNYGYHDLDAMEIGRDVIVEPYAYILVYRQSPHSDVPGRLILEDGSGIGYGVNIRAAGGTIRIGAGSGIAQNSVLIAANHVTQSDQMRLRARWDHERCGIDIGRNVWVGALCSILPGSVIGDGAVIAAGSVVRGAVPAGELWGGVPARKIKTLSAEGLFEKTEEPAAHQRAGLPPLRSTP
jgi:acetyltransferase-like isoleucine patch superfamily enzyme